MAYRSDKSLGDQKDSVSTKQVVAAKLSEDLVSTKQNVTPKIFEDSFSPKQDVTSKVSKRVPSKSQSSNSGSITMQDKMLQLYSHTRDDSTTSVSQSASSLSMSVNPTFYTGCGRKYKKLSDVRNEVTLIPRDRRSLYELMKPAPKYSWEFESDHEDQDELDFHNLFSQSRETLESKRMYFSRAAQRN